MEGLVGWSRRNFMVPLPRFASFEALNLYLKQRCRERQGDVLRGHRESIAKRLERDLEAMTALRTHGVGAPSEARRVYRADRAVAWGRSPQRLFKHWPAIFNHDATLTSAGFDRLLHHPETVTLEGNSFRMKNVIDK